MVKGYESVATQPAWQNMRNMKLHPKDAILPGGLVMSGNVLSTNIFYWRDPAPSLYRFSSVPYDHNETDNNLVWHAGLPITIGDNTWNPAPAKGLEQWCAIQAKGFDRHSVIADPLFVAPDKDDWRLKPDSPAMKLGFKPIPVEKIGPYKDPLRASWPIVEAAGAREFIAAHPGVMGEKN